MCQKRIYDLTQKIQRAFEHLAAALTRQPDLICHQAGL